MLGKSVRHIPKPGAKMVYFIETEGSRGVLFLSCAYVRFWKIGRCQYAEGYVQKMPSTASIVSQLFGGFDHLQRCSK